MQFDFILPLPQSLLTEGRQPRTRILQLREDKNTINAYKNEWHVNSSFTVLIHSVAEKVKPFSMRKVMQPYQEELLTSSQPWNYNMFDIHMFSSTFLSSGTRSRWTFRLGHSFSSSSLAISLRWNTATCADKRLARPLGVRSGIGSFCVLTSSTSISWVICSRQLSQFIGRNRMRISRVRTDKCTGLTGPCSFLRWYSRPALERYAFPQCLQFIKSFSSSDASLPHFFIWYT